MLFKLCDVTEYFGQSMFIHKQKAFCLKAVLGRQYVDPFVHDVKYSDPGTTYD